MLINKQDVLISFPVCPHSREQSGLLFAGVTVGETVCRMESAVKGGTFMSHDYVPQESAGPRPSVEGQVSRGTWYTDRRGASPHRRGTTEDRRGGVPGRR